MTKVNLTLHLKTDFVPLEKPDVAPCAQYCE